MESGEEADAIGEGDSEALVEEAEMLLALCASESSFLHGETRAEWDLGYAMALPLFKDDDLGEGITVTSIPISSSWCHSPCSHSTLVVVVLLLPAATASVLHYFLFLFLFLL